MKKDTYEKKIQRRNMIITIVVAVLMVSSILGYALLDRGSSSNDLTYGEYTFNIVQLSDGSNAYRTQVNNRDVDFQHFPTEVAYINLTNQTIQTLKNANQIIFLFNPNDNQENLVYVDFARYELETKLSVPVSAKITENSQNYNLPVASCEDATASSPIIYVNSSVTPSFVTDKDNPYCIIMNGKLLDLIALKDRLIYRFDNIMTS